MEVDFTEKIKSVFDVCDTEGTGYITVDHLKDLAKEHFGADNEEETVASSKQSTPTNSGNHSDFISSFHVTEHSTPEAQDTSEASAFTYNEYDTNTDEDGGQLLIDFSTPETSRRHLAPSHGHSSGRSSVTSKIDDYEDYGVVDLESDSSDANLSPNRRISSAVYASQLARGARSPHEDIYDDIDGSFQELTDRIKSLEKQLVKVSDEKSNEDNIKHRFKDENSILIKRIHSLEEQLKDMEVKSDDRVRAEQRKLHDIVAKNVIESEKMDYLTLRLQTVENENDRLKTDVVRLKNENDRLRMLLDELQKELEDLRRYKIECEHQHRHPARSPSISENGHTPLQSEMQKLKEANKHLAEENEELNAQLLYQALMKSLKEQQDVNTRLRQYVDKILLNILEKNPAMLEIH
ncbi:RFIP4-like protein [Mya arenaria]|uniref:RFIP4-like protein n=1 Tax=Mya arenaria TaxID=6604 RepID=A0ABY7DHJ6_MYAAR|nr:RFIP4-like protein [Mya arenaria]